MNKALFLMLSAALLTGHALHADGTTTTAAVAPAATPVAKLDAPGSLKAGNHLLGEGKYAEAAAYFNGIGEQSAANGKLKREPFRLLGLASADVGLGKYSEAEDAASQAIALDKDLAAAWMDLAVAQGSDGQRAKAIDTYTKGIAQLKADQVDTSRMEANLAYLQSFAAKGKGAKGSATAAASSGASTAATAATSTAQ